MPKLAVALPRNTTSRIGAILAAVSAVLIVLLAALDLGGFAAGLRLRILAYLLLPAAFVLGLLLLATGAWLERRRQRRAAHHRGSAPSLPVIDLNSPATRGTALLLLLGGCTAALILGGAGYQGIKVLESVEFCSQACHSVMQPEASAHDRSPHANVACVECHVGPGFGAWVDSKINGLTEMAEVATNSYPRPVPTPVHQLRPARVVCEQCHWPSAFVGDRLVVHTHYGEDDANTAKKTVLLLHVGGQAGKSNSGIHWHVARGVRIRYQADPSRESIYTVELTTPEGAQKVFGTQAVAPVDAQWRIMDCIDCHNRPTHVFRSPAQEVDAALLDGRIDTSLTFIKREAMRVLQAQYPSQEQARTAISRDIADFYRANYPDLAAARASAVTEAGAALGNIWSNNVFPQMKVTWNTYPNHLGHDDQSPGCLRCHDNKHVTTAGEKITRKCELCHNVVAEDEAAPEALKPFE
ncbi:MAG TPA: NapC/NirT family cytochrome c [Steroidobacteraceae bacterium]|nr:NapC/NirT family cytochrome c [Steroidobacteraceae bacterium]